MNTKVELLRTYFPGFREEFDIEKNIKSIILFEDMTDEERLSALFGKPKKLVFEFLKEWAQGIISDKEVYQKLQLEIQAELMSYSYLGGETKADGFLQEWFPELYVETFAKKKEGFKFEEELYPPFYNFIKFPIESLVNLVREEDPQTIAVILSILEKSPKTKILAERIRQDLTEDIPPPERRVNSSYVREIERVLERKLSTMHLDKHLYCGLGEMGNDSL